MERGYQKGPEIRTGVRWRNEEEAPASVWRGFREPFSSLCLCSRHLKIVIYSTYLGGEKKRRLRILLSLTADRAPLHGCRYLTW